MLQRPLRPTGTATSPADAAAGSTGGRSRLLRAMSGHELDPAALWEAAAAAPLLPPAPGSGHPAAVPPGVARRTSVGSQDGRTRPAAPSRRFNTVSAGHRRSPGAPPGSTRRMSMGAPSSTRRMSAAGQGGSGGCRPSGRSSGGMLGASGASLRGLAAQPAGDGSGAPSTVLEALAAAGAVAAAATAYRRPSTTREHVTAMPQQVGPRNIRWNAARVSDRITLVFGHLC